MPEIVCHTGDPLLDEMGEILIRNAAGLQSSVRIVLTFQAEDAADGDVLILLYRGENPPELPRPRSAALRCPYSIAELEETVRLLITSEEKRENKAVETAALAEEAETEPVFEGRTVSRGEVSVQLTKKEAALFAVLYENRGTAVSRERLTDTVWGGEVKTNLCDVYVCRLRTALEPIFGKGFLVNLRKDGYKMV